MQDVNVLVVFYSRTGATEKLALAAAVGAVQARANIRLRRLRETAEWARIESSPEWTDNHERMEKEYVAPGEADAAWADAVIIALPPGVEIPAPDWLRDLPGKVVTSLLSGAGPEQSPAPAAGARENALHHGRKVAEAARARKAGGANLGVS